MPPREFWTALKREPSLAPIALLILASVPIGLVLTRLQAWHDRRRKRPLT